MTNNLVIITDCDHPTVEIERKVLEELGFTVALEQCKTEDDVIEKCQGAVGLINQYAPLTKKVLSTLKECKVVVRYGVGVDNVDLDAASKVGIQVCNVPDYGVEEVSDHALGLIFSVIRKINLLSNNVKKNNWDFQISRPIPRLKDLTLGVVGLGRIGQATARKALGMGWNVIGCDPSERKGHGGIKIVSFEELIQMADIVSVHIPLTNKTHHLFNREVFAAMKKSAVIINTARGPIIDELSLVESIRNGDIAGAGIDVMEFEPPVPDHPLFEFDNVVLTPHAAWYSEESSFDLKRKAAEEVANVIQGNFPRNPVNVVPNLGDEAQ
jgi:D-3-phosphoglycerate dehydrogenase / 2-oxoglutarate reductase